MQNNETTITYVGSGRMGDFIHSLYIVKVMFETTGLKGDVFITNDRRYGGEPFSRDIMLSFKELDPIMKQQDYVNRFELLLDDNFILGKRNIVNLNMWRMKLHQNDWLHHLAACYNIPRNPSHWLTYKGDGGKKYAGRCIMHCSDIRTNHEFPWERILTKQNNFVFITSNPKEYEAFKYKHLVPMELVGTLEDMIGAIAHCKFFVGNQSAPAAIAVALEKPCLLSLYHLDARSYIQTDWCKRRCFWYVNDRTKYINVDVLQSYIFLGSAAA